MNGMQADIIIALLREISAKLGPGPTTSALTGRPSGPGPIPTGVVARGSFHPTPVKTVAAGRRKLDRVT